MGYVWVPKDHGLIHLHFSMSFGKYVSMFWVKVRAFMKLL